MAFKGVSFVIIKCKLVGLNSFMFFLFLSFTLATLAHSLTISSDKSRRQFSSVSSGSKHRASLDSPQSRLKSPKVSASEKNIKGAQRTIIIDPGHGGIYWGQVSIHGKLIEKNVVLDIAQRVAKRLRKRGYTVVLTRTKDVEFDKNDLINDLAQRARFTRTYNADIFVSLHLNGSKNKGLRGYEVYVPHEPKCPAGSYKLASSMHYELSHKIAPIFAGGALGNHNNIDHGVRASKFNVLTKAQCAAIVVELDYLSNAQTESMLHNGLLSRNIGKCCLLWNWRYFEC